MPDMLSVGELARATGVTVRALHHYEEIGLLPPSARTVSGHRRYGDEEMQRLYRIVALRGLGLSLAWSASATHSTAAGPPPSRSSTS